MYKPPRFYKYVEQAHLSEFLQSATLRIGTLYEYRDIEKYGTTVGDDEEGVKHIEEHFPRIDLMTPAGSPLPKVNWTGPEDVPQRLKDRIHIEPGGRVNIHIVANESISSPDLYVFSVTEEFSREVMQELGRDACYCIEDPSSFLRELNAVMWDKYEAKALSWQWCKYGPRQEFKECQTDVHPAIIKPPKYKHQKEVRALWAPTAATIEPVIVSCPQARCHCLQVWPPE